jgi:hypothetical protein
MLTKTYRNQSIVTYFRQAWRRFYDWKQTVLIRVGEETNRLPEILRR